MALATSLYRMADRQLGGDLEEFLRVHRARGDTWAQIHADLRVKHEVEVTPETLRQWARRLGIEPTDNGK